MVLINTLPYLIGLFALLLWIPQNVIHEGSHALVAKHFGALITKFWPFPSKLNGTFTFAHVSYVIVQPLNKTSKGLIAIAPLLVNTLILSVLWVLRSHIDFGTIVNSLIAAFAITNFLDGAVNLSTFYRKVPKSSTDGWKFQSYLGFQPLTMRLLAIYWKVTFILALFLSILFI